MPAYDAYVTLLLECVDGKYDYYVQNTFIRSSVNQVLTSYNMFKYSGDVTKHLSTNFKLFKAF